MNKKTQGDTSNELRQFLIAALFFMFCAFIPTILSALIYNRSLASLVIGDEPTMHSFYLAMYLRDFIYRWLFLLALVPAVAAIRSMATLLVFVFGLHVFDSILAGLSYRSLSIAFEIFVPQNLTAILFIPLNGLFVWFFVKWEKSSLSYVQVHSSQSAAYYQFLKKSIAAFVIPIIGLAIPIALFVSFAFLSREPLLLFFLMPIASSLIYFWRVLLVAAIGLSIANFFGARDWSRYFATACATIPVISEVPQAFFWSGDGSCPECRMNLYSYILVSLVVCFWYIGLRNRFISKVA